jgi:hypothetical protein
MSTSKLSSACLILFILVSVFIPVAFSLNMEDEATSAISEAEEATVSAYRAVLDAESAGADVTSLMSQLNKAAELLAQANMSYEIHDFKNATLFAGMSKGNATEVIIKAHKTRDLALYENSQRFKFTLAASILSICMILFVSFMSWRFFKRRYCNRILKLKPELNSDES